MKYKDKKMLFGIGIVFLFLATVSFTYAYFTATIVNKDVKDQVVQTGTLQLTYTDGPEIIMNNIKPGVAITKEISVKNTGTLDASYNLVWQELNNEIGRNDMVMEITCTRMNGDIEEGTCDGIEEKPIKTKRIKDNISIEDGITHKYVFTITLKDTNTNQNYNQGKKFSGVLGIEEYKNDAKPIYCTTDIELTKGAQYINGQYEYMYQQRYYTPNDKTYGTQDLSTDGWSIYLVDYTSTDPVTTDVCTYINGKPVVSANGLYSRAKATSVDLSSFAYNEIVDMEDMFGESNFVSLNLSQFNTSKVKNMKNMFFSIGSKSQNVTLVGFDTLDTSNVTDMSYMFYGSYFDNFDLSNFDTSMVTNMSYMFDDSNISNLDLSSFDTSNVTDMSGIFSGFSSAFPIDLRSFDTSRVTSMSAMFYNTKIAKVDISSFDTSNVSNMYMMFYNTNVDVDFTVLDTRNVSNMYYMFYQSKYNIRFK